MTLKDRQALMDLMFPKGSSHRWMQHHEAAQDDREWCDYDHSHATRFCLVGALHRVLGPDGFWNNIRSVAAHCLQRSARAIRHLSVDELYRKLLDWNDSAHRHYSQVEGFVESFPTRTRTAPARRRQR